jgi:hypothetical protein
MNWSIVLGPWWPNGLLVLVQILGIAGLLLGRMSHKSADPWLLQAFFFLALVVVAAVAFLCLEVQNQWWIVTGGTFSVMVVGGAIDLRGGR